MQIKDNQKARFIVIEGIDKSGKDTQARFLCDFLNSQNKKAIITFEPTDNNFWGRLIHFILKNRIKLPSLWFQKMYYWDRLCHQKEIKYYLKQGYYVICVRYFFSTIAYGYYGGLDINKIVRWHKKVIWPRFVIFLDISAQQAVRRLELEGGKGEFFEKERKLEKIRQGYFECIKLFPNLFKTIDGERSKEEIFKEVLETFNNFIIADSLTKKE